jgi:hypothetical protein
MSLMMFAALLRLIDVLPGNVLLTLATLTVASLLLLASRTLARGEHRASLARVRTTLRERTLRMAYLAQRDPDAAGRPRPRAPGLKVAA